MHGYGEMKMKMCLIIFFQVISIFVVNRSGLAQEKESSQSYLIGLTLSEAINKALENNTSLKASRYRVEIDKEMWENSWYNYYFPKLTVSLNSLSQKTFYQIEGSKARSLQEQEQKTGTSFFSSQYPQPTNLSLNLEEYNLFSFWQKARQLRMDEMNFVRNQQRHFEQIRNIRFDIVKQYNDFYLKQSLLEIQENVLKEETAILNLIKILMKSNKASQVDYDASKLDIDDVQRNIEMYKQNLAVSNGTLNQSMGESSERRYKPLTYLKHQPIKLSFSKIKVLYQNSPAMKDIQISNELANLSIETAERNRLPMPSLSISKVMWSQEIYYERTANNVSTGSFPDGNLDLRLSINWVIPIFNEGGLFNQRAVRIARLNREIALTQLKGAEKADYIRLNSALLELSNIDSAISSLENSKRFAEKLLKDRLKFLSLGRLDRYEVKNAVDTLHRIEGDLISKIVDYMSKKIEIAQILGLDYLPGDNSCLYSYCD